MPVTKGTPRLFIPGVDSSLIGGALVDKAEFLKDREDQRGRFAEEALVDLVKILKRLAESFLYAVHQEFKSRTTAEYPAVITITYGVRHRRNALAEAQAGWSTRFAVMNVGVRGACSEQYFHRNL